MKSTFLKLFIIHFQDILFLKEFFVKKGSGNSLWYKFCAWFSNKNDPYLILLSMDQVSMSYRFSFLRYQIKCVIEFLFRYLMTPQTLRSIFDPPLKQCLTRKRRGEDGNYYYCRYYIVTTGEDYPKWKSSFIIPAMW